MNERLSSWAIGLGAGMCLAVLFFFVGLVVTVAGAALLLAMAASLRTLALASGILIGLGGSWTLLLLAAEARCASFDQQPNQACTSSGNEPFLAIYLGITTLGILLGAGAVWRGRSALG